MKKNVTEPNMSGISYVVLFFIIHFFRLSLQEHSIIYARPNTIFYPSKLLANYKL